MSITSVSAPNVAAGGAGAETVTVNYSATPFGFTANLRLVAISETGTETGVFKVFSGFAAGGSEVVTFDNDFVSALPPGNYTLRVDVLQGNPPGNFSGPVSGETLICFLEGTRISTPTGAIAVESLRQGDLVLTADGRAVPVMWLGLQTVVTRFSSAELRRPVVIRAGALGDNVPARDLRVTPGHALLLDGVLVNASALVNGDSIRRMSLAELGDRFTVFHIETADHEIILAEGAPAETFIDNVSRSYFDNYADFVARYGDESRPMAELDAPRAMSARQVPPAIRARIAARASCFAGDDVIAA